MKKRKSTLRKKAFKQDNFTCRKCKIEDKELKTIEAHHITPLHLGGKDELDNIVTLCSDCHYYAPNKKEDFEEYMKEEMEGKLTIFMKAWKKAIQENPELFEELKNKRNNKN